MGRQVASVLVYGHRQHAGSYREMTQRKPWVADWGKLAAEILPGGQHDYPTSLLAD